MNYIELHNTLGFKIIQTGRLLSKKINADFQALNAEITYEQMGVLYYIAIQGEKEIIQQDLAEIMNKTKSAVLRNIDILERKKYLTRIKKNGDRRSNVILIAKKGNQILDKTQQLFLSLEAIMGERLSEKEKLNCAKVLDKIKGGCI